MSTNETLFGIRFGSNEELYPSKAELREFLESPKQDGVSHAKDMEPYQKLLADYADFERRKNVTAETIDHRERLFYAVLGHSGFLNQAVITSVELYKYNVRFLKPLDFKKPSSFVKAAEEELHTLDPKKEHSVRVTRLLDMMEDRKASIERMTRIWMTISEELVSIIDYLRENLAKINRICRMSLDILGDRNLTENEEARLAAEIKTQFKDQMKDALHRGEITRQQLETVQNDVATLLSELSAYVKKDVDALKRLYQTLVDHTGSIVASLDALMKEYRGMPSRVFEKELELFLHAENALVSLVSDIRLDLHASVTKSGTPYLGILAEKRTILFDDLFEKIRRDRRTVSDRRIASERRKFRDPEYSGPERRSGKDRRSGAGRRKQPDQ
ncbi:MAG TPA: hypothetical protein VK654_12505 [Nitrospirota bacterium]|nr:hypothetical protein [Nitrospirota bacterium]